MVRKRSAEGSVKAFWGRGRDDAATFERLYRESYGMVYNYVCYFMADSSAAEDVTAEAFLKAARAFDRFDPARAKFSTWVITIARNCALDYLGKSKPASNIEDVPEGAFATQDSYPRLNEDEELVRTLLAELDPKARELVYMKYYLDKRNVDIARELGMNESTVATKLQRALLKMRATAERDA